MGRDTDGPRHSLLGFTSDRWDFLVGASMELNWVLVSGYVLCHQQAQRAYAELSK